MLTSTIVFTLPRGVLDGLLADLSEPLEEVVTQSPWSLVEKLMECTHELRTTPRWEDGRGDLIWMNAGWDTKVLHDSFSEREGVPVLTIKVGTEEFFDLSRETIGHINWITVAFEFTVPRPRSL